MDVNFKPNQDWTALKAQKFVNSFAEVARHYLSLQAEVRALQKENKMLKAENANLTKQLSEKEGKS